jgi:hypothetical protein
MMFPDRLFGWKKKRGDIHAAFPGELPQDKDETGSPEFPVLFPGDPFRTKMFRYLSAHLSLETCSINFSAAAFLMMRSNCATISMPSHRLLLAGTQNRPGRGTSKAAT